MKTMKLAPGLFALCLLAPAGAWAAVLELMPSEAVVLPEDGSGKTKVAFKFDLSEVPTRAGLEIDEALLDWTLAGGEDRAEYFLYEPTAAWTQEGVTAGMPVTCAENARADWQLETLDLARIGGFVRFDVEPLVSAWVSGKSANHGLVVSTPDVDGMTLSGSLATARLIIRYGFSGPK